MKISETEIPGAFILEPALFGDSRGYFAETYNQRLFDEMVGHPVRFVQDNESRSAKGVLRGLHCQLPPHEQGKLVRVSAGRVLDVVVDLRPDSPRCGKWIAVELSAENHKQLWVPPGLAHGFIVLSDSADLQYKVTDFYHPECDRSIRWDDPELAIAWPELGAAPQVSAKDLRGSAASVVLSEIRDIGGFRR